ncbi:hypothetical protein [uncultured Microscilla sp.]|uniref:hypothetical protein n=1 Tax=uncultured Microscilla sp. TaxID=432653 RepID=UPI002620949E|nr:hypothetical protein [uncultured Microscilla sp.]
MSNKKKQQAPPTKKKGGGFTRFLLFIVLVGGIGGGVYIYLNPQTDPSIKVAISFYNHLQSKNYEQAVAMFDKNMLKQRTKEEWIQWLKQRNEQYKGINGYKLNQVSKLSDSQNNKRLVYASVQYGDSTRYEQVHFLQAGEQYRVLDYLTKRSKDEANRNTTLN